jgi:hypothetical protein
MIPKQERKKLHDSKKIEKKPKKRTNETSIRSSIYLFGYRS